MRSWLLVLVGVGCGGQRVAAPRSPSVPTPEARPAVLAAPTQAAYDAAILGRDIFGTTPRPGAEALPTAVSLGGRAVSVKGTVVAEPAALSVAFLQLDDGPTEVYPLHGAVDGASVEAIVPHGVSLKVDGASIFVPLGDANALTGASPAGTPSDDEADDVVLTADAWATAWRAVTAGRGAVRARPTTLDDGTRGVRLGAVRSGSPAHTLGLQSGDVLHRVDGRVVASADALPTLVSSASSSDVRTVDVIRRGTPISLTYRLR